MDSRFQVLCCFLLLLASCHATPKTIQVRCKAGEFLKAYPLFSCGRCDSNCAIGKCRDIEGCTECDSGYYLSREDDQEPKECLPCKIEGCSKCKDNVYDKDGATCSVPADGYDVAHDGKNCFKIEESAPVPAVKSAAPEEEAVVAYTPEKTTPVVSEPKTEEYEATPSAVAASTDKKDAEPSPTPVTHSEVPASPEEKEYEPAPYPVETATSEPSVEGTVETRVSPNQARAKASVSTVFNAEGEASPVTVAGSVPTKKELVDEAPAVKKDEKPYKEYPSPAVEKKEEKPYKEYPSPAVEKKEEKPYKEYPSPAGEKKEEKPYKEYPSPAGEKKEEKPYKEYPSPAVEKKEEKPYETTSAPATKEEVKVPVTSTDQVVTEAPVEETPVGSTAGESYSKPTTTEPVVEKQDSVKCAYPEGCEDGHFFNIKTCKCEPCDVNCVLGHCENDKGCTLCKPGYFVVRKESADPGTCVECTVPYCKLCSAGVLGLSPLQCIECEKGYKLSDDKKSCTKIQPVVLNKSKYCPPGQFYKTEGKMCVDCDAYCKPGYCEDDKGCMKCKPGYYTSREDAFWPRKCLPCDIKYCAECTNNVYDHWTPTCAKCDPGYQLCEGDTACKA